MKAYTAGSKSKILKSIVTVNGVYSVLNVHRKATAFSLWRAIESRWNRNIDSLCSSMTAVNVCATLLGARHVAERLCGGSVYFGAL